MARRVGTNPRMPREKTARPGGMSLQQRIESNPTGRGMISGVILFTVFAMIISNLPASTLRRTAFPTVKPLLDMTGLGQNWNLFAPNPRRSTLRLQARIDFSDGTSSVWRTPISDPYVGAYRAFRWRKWASYVVSDSRAFLWPPTARWLASIHARDGKTPVRVTLFLQFYYAPKPGTGDMRQPPWKEEVLYSTTNLGRPE